MRWCIRFVIIITALIPLHLSAQKLLISPLESIDGRGTVKVIGMVDDKLVSFLDSYGGYELIWHDSAMRRIGSSDLEFLERRVETFEIYSTDEAAFVFFQKKKRRSLELWAAKVRPIDKDTIYPVLIDSMELRDTWDKTRFQFHESLNQNRFVYSIIGLGNSEGTVLRINAINENLESVHSFEQPLSNRIGNAILNVLLDTKDGIHILSGESINQYGSEGRLQMQSIAVGRQESTTSSLELNGFKLKSVLVRSNPSDQNIYLGSLLFKGSDRVVSALGVFVYDPENRQWVKSNITTKGERNSVQMNELVDVELRDLLVKKDGGCTFVMEKTFEEVYERNRNIGFVTPGLSMGSSSYSVYHNDEIYVYSITSNGDLDWNEVINKTQETSDGNQRFHSFGLLKYPLGGVFLFTDFTNNQNRFINAYMSATGKLRLKQFQTSNYKNIEDDGLLLRGSKQVTANEIVFPIIKRGTLSFAKIIF